MAEPQPDAAYAHPVAALFTIAFKAAALMMYILSGIIGLGFIGTFVLVVVLLMLDFWTLLRPLELVSVVAMAPRDRPSHMQVKNVSGRLLVGLRWWNEVTDEGSNWRFESLAEGQREINKQDKFIFWWSLYLAPCIWALFGLVALLKFSFEYLLVVAVAVVLAGANVIGYTKCSKEAKQNLTNMATNAVRSHLTAGLARMNPFAAPPASTA